MEELTQLVQYTVPIGLLYPDDTGADLTQFVQHTINTHYSNTKESFI